MKKLRILFVSLICILLLAMALPAATPVAASAPDAPAPAAAAAPALELAEEGTVMVSVAEDTGSPVSARGAPAYVLAAGLILITIAASVAYLRRRFSSTGHSIADTRSPGTSGNCQCYGPGG